ncbi:hypothetical protein ACFL6T_00135 [Candidatus Zixiibacteriota bacterium]
MTGFLLLACTSDPPTGPSSDDPPALDRVIEVYPVFFIPTDQDPPDAGMETDLLAHLDIARDRYEVLLNNRDTFRIRSGSALRYQAENDLLFYRAQMEGPAPLNHIAGELLDHLGTDRHRCDYVLLVVVMNPADQWPVGGGIPINAGLNTGGGYVELSSFLLDGDSAFQSTLQHELGHAFGLPHSDVYGFDMETHISIMSYNPDHWWTGFTPPEDPGILAPEDLRALALNAQIFPDLTFDPVGDVPPGYLLPSSFIVLYPPILLPGEPEYLVIATSTSGSSEGTEPGNAVNRSIWAANTFNDQTMWVSGDSGESGWVPLTVEFPVAEALDWISIHSQQQGGANLVETVRVEVRINGNFIELAEKDLTGPDDHVTFPSRTSDVWRLSFRAGTSGKVTIRGIQFFEGNVQINPPLFPYMPSG